MLLSIPDWSWLQWTFLLVGGVACGFTNTLAGGGSFITIPLLIYLGQTPLVANATNRLALVVQTGTAAAGFWASGERDIQTVGWLALPGLLGSLIGAQLAVHLDPLLFRRLFAALLLLAVIPVLARPRIFDNLPPQHDTPPRPSTLLLVCFFGVGLYSGFIQVGVGVWSLLLLLMAGHMQVNHANAVKSQLLLLTTGAATCVFLWADQVVLSVGLALSVGNATGAWLATRLVRDRKVPWLRWFILAGAVAAFVKLFGWV